MHIPMSLPPYRELLTPGEETHWSEASVNTEQERPSWEILTTQYVQEEQSPLGGSAGREGLNSPSRLQHTVIKLILLNSP